MLEQGLFNLIQSAVPSGVQGFAVEFPKDLISPSNPKAWLWRGITSNPLYSLNGQNAWTVTTIRIDCHGITMKDAMSLAKTIRDTLSGWRGTMTDADSTVVQAILMTPLLVDGFDDANRSFVRTIEVDIQYLAS